MKNYVIVWKGGDFLFVPKCFHYQFVTEWNVAEDIGFCVKGFRLKFN
jgi:hypothetical protein